MGNIGDSISTSVPTVGSSGPGYATDINTLLTEFKARLTARIPLSSLLANANFDLNGQAILNADYVQLSDQANSPASSPTNRATAYNGDLWWVGPAGALQVTNGTSLNAAGVGGITGDYSGSGPMEFRYDTANTRYDAFANQSTNTWAYVRARGFDVAAGATSNFRARILFGGGANTSYTLPAAAPAAAQVVTMDSTGALLVDGVLGSNTDITLAGTGKIKHGNYTMNVALFKFLTSGSATVSDVNGAAHINIDSGTQYIPLALNWPQTRRLKSVAFAYAHTGAGTINYEIVAFSPLSSSFGSLANPPTASSTAGSGTKTLTTTGNDALPSASLTTTLYYLKVTAPASNNVDLAQMQYVYDTP